ncbi:hypothetical protein F3J37_01430 [Pantoea sp. Al-1710]|uniref:Transcriptional regulator n=1 Tax=Candidatus Pantoea communis TaxID=2608354 RepID=A0ABX0RNN1_9GAMM|nr:MULTISPECIES: hypothetical protein [Pantoea]NIG12960.1 hypothetical protein [Pantoea sp. Cy-640]NIG17339.1 hypothetical protein [Pantoea communis]
MHSLTALQCDPTTLFPERERCSVSTLFTRPDVSRLRQSLNVNSEQLASIIGVSPSLANGWINNTRKPLGPSRKLLCLLERHPSLADELKDL